MSSIKVIEYKGDKKVLVKLIEELQDYLVKVDPLKRRIRLPEYGEIYIDNLLKEISENNGIIYIAEFKNTPVGMIAVIIEEFTKNDEIEYISSKPAKVLELIVSEKNRGKNIGKLLMDKMEEYFKTKECDIIQVKVFEPNKDAHGFYKKLGYQDRFIDMIKESK